MHAWLRGGEEARTGSPAPRAWLPSPFGPHHGGTNGGGGSSVGSPAQPRPGPVVSVRQSCLPPLGRWSQSGCCFSIDDAPASADSTAQHASDNTRGQSSVSQREGRQSARQGKRACAKVDRSIYGCGGSVASLTGGVGGGGPAVGGGACGVGGEGGPRVGQRRRARQRAHHQHPAPTTTHCHHRDNTTHPSNRSAQPAASLHGRAHPTPPRRA
jgi:hypothetical protein